MTKEDYLELKNKILTYPNISDDKRREALMQLEMGKQYGFGTGYPTIDQVWLKHYKKGAADEANNIPTNKTVWDVIEEKLIEYYDIPALEYFGRLFSRPEFRDLCYTWARTFRAMGVETGEVVPVYGPFVPDICAMVFALNMIGACPYFLKLAISPEALAEETKEAKVAVVYDGMWGNVAQEFSKDRFKKVIVATVTADMPSPKKQIVSFISNIQARKNKCRIPDDDKYIMADKARDISNYYTGNVKVPFEPNRSAFITSSSGTTIGGVVKGTVATNEATISQLYMGKASNTQFFPGDRCLNHFPPTASTSLNLLFLTALYSGETVILDPRVSKKDFYNQLVYLKPNQALHTGSAWDEYFNTILYEMNQGKVFDFSYAKGWTIGGEGTDIKKYTKWMEIMRKCNCDNELYIGFGLSELFSATTASKNNVEMDFSKPIMSVGIPYAGINLGIFDENGNELQYNQRGEIWVKSKSAMKGYYNKPKLTEKVKIDGVIHTGDIGEIDEEGRVYVYGRMKDNILLSNGEKFYLFDVANEIKKNKYIDDALVLSLPTDENCRNLVAHISWNDSISFESKKDLIEMINEDLKSYLPNEVEVGAYYEHDGMIPYSPTTLKKDKNKLSKITKGYYQVIDGNLNEVEYFLNDSGNYSKKCDIINKGMVKRLNRK